MWPFYGSRSIHIPHRDSGEHQGQALSGRKEDTNTVLWVRTNSSAKTAALESVVTLCSFVDMIIFSGKGLWKHIILKAVS